MAYIWNDLRVSLRGLRRGRGFAAASLTAIALATGANTAVFSLVYSVILRPLPFPEPDRLLSVTQLYPSFKDTVVTAPMYFDWQTQNAARLAAYSIGEFTLTGGEVAESVEAGRVSHQFFSVLGVNPETGRTFTAAEDRPNSDNVVVVSRAFWNGRPRRNSIRLDGRAYQVIGEMPASFDFPPGARLWLPLALDPDAGHAGGPVELVRIIARLHKGADAHSLTAALSGISARARGFSAGGTPVVVPLRTWLTGKTRQVWLVLIGVVAFVLLIACANVAGLLIARSAARRRETAIRVALGAPARRLIQQSFVESLVLATIGSAIGLALGYALVRGLVPLIPDAMLAGRPVRIDTPVFLFTAGTAVVIALFFGMAPAARMEIRGALVVAEVALSFGLLTTAALMARSFAAVTAVDPGFRADHVLTLAVTLPGSSYSVPARQFQFFSDALDRLAALPGVRASALSSTVPFTAMHPSFGMASVEGEPAWDTTEALRHRVEAGFISPLYFAAMGTPLIEGRDLGPTDDQAAIVNQAFVRRFFPGGPATGHRIKMGPVESPAPWLTVVGVARDSKRGALEEEVGPAVFRPFRQRANLRSAGLVLRTAGDPAAFSESCRRTLASLDAAVAVSDVEVLEHRLQRALASQKLRSVASLLLACLALAMVITGLYGVLSYLVIQRGPEFGVRMAIGAGPRQIFELVLRRGIFLAFAGIAAGLPLSLFASAALRGLLFGVSPADPLTLAGAAAVMLALALAASAAPAYRATRTDPIRCLRQE
jgi:putative ABC transport system permease protein